MIQRTSQPLIILLGTLALIAAASWLRLDVAPQLVTALHLKTKNADRVVYYRVDPQAGPTFRLNGGETEVRILSHLALPRAVAWPAVNYDPERTYEYGFAFRLRDQEGHELWRRNIYLTTRQSKAGFVADNWTLENAFSEDPERQLGDLRLLYVQLPNAVPVDAVLELRFLGDAAHFAFARGYRVVPVDAAEERLKHYTLSPMEKQALVAELTFLEWDELDWATRRDRLAHRLERLAAVSDAETVVNTEAIYTTSFRLPPAPYHPATLEWMGEPWQRNYVFEGPTQVNFEVIAPPSSDVSLLSRRQWGEQHFQLRLTDRTTTAQERVYENHIVVRHGPSQPVALTLGPGIHNVAVDLRATHATLSNAIDTPTPSTKSITPRTDPRVHPPGIAATAPPRDDLLGLAAHISGLAPRQLTHYGWTQASTHDAPAATDEILSPTYYVDVNQPSLHFPVEGPAGEARSLRIRVRALTPPLPEVNAPSLDVTAAPIGLNLTFLDEHWRELLSTQGSAQQPFDRHAWIEQMRPLASGSENAPSGPVISSVSQTQEWKIIAPATARWLALHSTYPAVIEVHAFADMVRGDGSPLAPPFSLIALDPTLQWRLAPEQPRLWFALRAHEHSQWIAAQAALDVVGHLRFEPREAALLATPPVAWMAIEPIGRPERQRILESIFETPSQALDTRDPKALAVRFPFRWSELLQGYDYVVTDDPTIVTEPHLLYRTTNPRSRDPTAGFFLMIDELTLPWRWRALRDVHSLPQLRGGPHVVRWHVDDSKARLWIDRKVQVSSHAPSSAIPSTRREYVQRNLFEVAPTTGLRYRVFKPSAEPYAVNVHLYRRALASSPTASPTTSTWTSAGGDTVLPATIQVEVEIDNGAPVRAVGQLTQSLTRAQRIIEATATPPTQVIFLDDNLSGTYEDFGALVGLGDDLKPGWHNLVIRPLAPGTWWARAFARDVTAYHNEARRWSSQPANPSQASLP